MPTTEELIEFYKQRRFLNFTDLLYAQNKLMQELGITPEQLKGTLVSIIGEAYEAYEELDVVGRVWKQKDEIDLEKIKNELIDILFFWLQTVLLIFDYEDINKLEEKIAELYRNKLIVNYERKLKKENENARL